MGKWATILTASTEEGNHVVCVCGEVLGLSNDLVTEDHNKGRTSSHSCVSEENPRTSEDMDRQEPSPAGGRGTPASLLQRAVPSAAGDAVPGLPEVSPFLLPGACRQEVVGSTGKP